jgi:hypothetical protein
MNKVTYFIIYIIIYIVIIHAVNNDENNFMKLSYNVITSKYDNEFRINNLFMESYLNLFIFILSIIIF